MSFTDKFRTHAMENQAALRNDAAGSASETQTVFNALTRRIARENTELYPLADRTS